MQTEEMIPASEFCTHYHIELSFIQSLQQTGLIECVTAQETLFVPASQLPQLEKMVRLHYDMDINMEGIETITHLLQRITEMQQKITLLSNRLGLYEDGNG